MGTLMKIALGVGLSVFCCEIPRSTATAPAAFRLESNLAMDTASTLTPGGTGAVKTNKSLSGTYFQGILYAEDFAGGVPAAVQACPPNGCIIYAIAPQVNLNLGSIDPGTKAISIYLGPYTFSVKQITLRKSLKIIGMGASGGPVNGLTCTVTMPCNGTTLQSVNGNEPVFVIPQDNNDPATHVLLSGFNLLGSAGNTGEDGFFLDTKSTKNSGLWYSTIRDISISGFAGIGFHIRGRVFDFASGTQWVLVDDVAVFRTPGGGNALRMEGAVFELRFTNCQFDGQAIGDGTNVYIGTQEGAQGGNGEPTSIVFQGLVSQNAALAVLIDGGLDITFYGSHHENLWNAYQIKDDFGMWTEGLTIADSYFAGNVGVNGGSGYLLNVTTTLASGIFFVHNRIMGTPDNIVQGTNLASVAYQDNMACLTCGSLPTSGITTQMSPASTIDIRGAHSVGLNPSATPITTIQSSLGPGEMVTFFTFAGSVEFASGGNIDLMGVNTLAVNGSITFVRNDLLGGLQWVPVSQWTPPSTGTPPRLR